MSAGLAAYSGRRAARLVATVGLCVGGICLLVAAVVYLGPAPDVLPAALAETRRQATAKDLSLAAVAVLGTVMVSIGAVFALLERTGVLSAVTVPRHRMEELEPRHNLPVPQTRRGESAPARGNPAQVPMPVPDPGGSSVGYPEPGVSRSRGDARARCPGSPTGGASRTDPTGHPPVHAEEPSEIQAVGRGREEAAGAKSDVQLPAPSASVTEVAERQLVAGEPPAAKAPQPGDLITAWDNYRRDGDGHFSRRGLQSVLDQRGLAANVSAGDPVGAVGAVLIVETPPNSPRFYVLPSFNKSPRSVADWFDDSTSGALTGRPERLVRVAQGRWVESEAGIERRFEVIERGEIA